MRSKFLQQTENHTSAIGGFSTVENASGSEPLRSTGTGGLGELLIKINGGGKFELKQSPPDHKRIDIGNYYGNYELIHSKLGWQPKVSLEKALQETLRFYRENLKHYL